MSYRRQRRDGWFRASSWMKCKYEIFISYSLTITRRDPDLIADSKLGRKGDAKQRSLTF